MASLVRYCLTQSAHHGLPDDPAIATGSCFPDLIGARRLPGLTLRVTTALPRFRLRDAYEAVGLASPLSPAGDAELRALGGTRLAELVSATLCTGPGFAGNHADVVRGRRVAAHLAQAVGLRPRDLALPLGITETAAARLSSRSVEKADLGAVRVRVALEGAVATRGRVALTVRGSPLAHYDAFA